MRTRWTALAVAGSVAVVALVAFPRVRDEMTANRTGIAPGSSQATRFAPLPDGRFVAIGAQFAGDTAKSVAWLVDGDAWNPLGDARTDRLFTDVAAAGGRVIAAGSERGVPAIFERRLDRPASSPWAVVHRAEVTGDGFGEFSALAVRGDAVVAAGSLHHEQAIAAVRSGDGWSEHAIGKGWTPVVAASESEFLVGAADGDSSPTVWASTDGTAFTAVSLPEAAGGPRSALAALAVAAHSTAAPGTAVAVGQAGADPVAWRRDASGWTLGSLPGTGPGRSISAATATADGRFVAVGRQIGLGDVTTPLAWTADASGAWRPAAVMSDGHSELTDVLVTTRSTVVALGNVTRRKRITPVILELRGSVFLPYDGAKEL